MADDRRSHSCDRGLHWFRDGTPLKVREFISHDSKPRFGSLNHADPGFRNVDFTSETHMRLDPLNLPSASSGSCTLHAQGISAGPVGVARLCLPRVAASMGPSLFVHDARAIGPTSKKFRRKLSAGRCPLLHRKRPTGACCFSPLRVKSACTRSMHTNACSRMAHFTP